MKVFCDKVQHREKRPTRHHTHTHIISVMVSGICHFICLCKIPGLNSGRMVAPIPIRIIFGLYAMVFSGALLAGGIGLITGPRHWIRRLCKWNLWITGIFFALLAGTLLLFTLSAALRGEIESAPALLFINLLCFPLLLVFLLLLAVWFWRVSPPKG
jgi:hypothetical protein